MNSRTGLLWSTLIRQEDTHFLVTFSQFIKVLWKKKNSRIHIRNINKLTHTKVRVRVSELQKWKALEEKSFIEKRSRSFVSNWVYWDSAQTNIWNHTGLWHVDLRDYSSGLGMYFEETLALLECTSLPFDQFQTKIEFENQNRSTDFSSSTKQINHRRTYSCKKSTK